MRMKILKRVLSLIDGFIRPILRLLFSFSIHSKDTRSSTLYKRFVSYRELLTGQTASDEIKRLVEGDKPCMVARFGSLELMVAAKYRLMRQKDFRSKLTDYINTGDKAWWDIYIRTAIKNNSGFFPVTSRNLERFSLLMINSMKKVDLLGSWVYCENLFDEELINAKVCPLRDLEPYFHEKPWTEALKNKKVLVIHPFADSIKYQYEYNRANIYSNPEVLPNFELLTIKAVQSSAGNRTQFKIRFNALDFMVAEGMKIDFDVAIVGCGAYGFPLAAKIKEMGKKAIHLGGPLQILFGIKGKYWDRIPLYSNLYNSYWIRPSKSETPRHYKRVDSGDYW